MFQTTNQSWLNFVFGLDHPSTYTSKNSFSWLFLTYGPILFPQSPPVLEDEIHEVPHRL